MLNTDPQQVHGTPICWSLSHLMQWLCIKHSDQKGNLLYSFYFFPSNFLEDHVQKAELHITTESKKLFVIVGTRFTLYFYVF